jgi:Zn-dependent protease with chaperone function
MKRLAALAIALTLTGFGLAPARADQESDIGAQVYQQLQAKGEIIARPNPLYNYLDPIAVRIKRVADPQYTYPFQFILVHETQPNAFAVPGGNVYVTDTMMRFAKDQEELAGVLCHETSHDIHHDVVNLNAKAQTQGAVISILGSLLGVDRSAVGQVGEQLVYSLQTTRFSREVETAADLKGADTCAQAGFNPHGLIWLFEEFEKSGGNQGAEAISDHPRDDHRISDLLTHFQQNPALFGRFSSDIATATPLDRSASIAYGQGGNPYGPGAQYGQGNPSLTFYSGPNENGNAYNFTKAVADLTNYGPNDSVRSVVVSTGSWRICSDINYGGECVTLAPGTYSNFRISQSTTGVGSIQPVADTANYNGSVDGSTDIGNGIVTLFVDKEFGGPAINVNRSVRNLTDVGFNDQASSLVVRSGRWQFCDDADFGGHCVVLGPGRYPDLQNYRLNDKISSLRPY